MPEELHGLRHGVLRGLETLADNLVEWLLVRRGTTLVPCSKPATRLAACGPQTASFQALYPMLKDVATLVWLLDRAAGRLTNAEPQRWHITLADPATYEAAVRGSVAVALYPAGTDVQNMEAVPPEVRIFRLEQEAPYDITELLPHSPKRIARERRKIAIKHVKIANEQWWGNRRTYCAAIAQRVREELARRGHELDPELRNAIVDLLVGAEASGYQIAGIMQAASYLGIFNEVTGGFGQPKNE